MFAQHKTKTALSIVCTLTLLAPFQVTFYVLCIHICTLHWEFPTMVLQEEELEIWQAKSTFLTVIAFLDIRKYYRDGHCHANLLTST